MIHTVDPIYRDGSRGEEKQLASAYRESLKLARKKGIRSLAFPSLSTGAYGYPLDEATAIALKTVVEFIKENPVFDRVGFVLFGRPSCQAYERALRKRKT